MSYGVLRMSARIAYYRVSTKEQTIESQRTALGGNFDVEFSDVGISGAVLAADRPGLAALMRSVQSGSTIYVYAADRLGRDAIDVQTTIRDLQKKGVAIHIHGIGLIEGATGKIIVALLSQLAEIERDKILERCNAGRATARESIATTGKTHHGKESLGRRMAGDAAKVTAWRTKNKASIAETAKHFNLSAATIKRYANKD